MTLERELMGRVCENENGRNTTLAGGARIRNSSWSSCDARKHGDKT